MTHTLHRAIACGLMLASIAAAPALAQSSGDYRSYYAQPHVNVPFNSRTIGIPGPARTCVKWCEFDDSPCDPPVYKQEDGRCNYR